MSEVRICENCNYHNNINNLECEKCGYDLSFVLPVDESMVLKKQELSPASDESQAENLTLISADNKVSIPIENEMVVGRDGICGSYFEKSNFVSRKHAIFYIENGQTFIFDASTNGTYLNDKKLPKLTKIPVHTSDKIVFADLIFEVKNAD